MEERLKNILDEQEHIEVDNFLSALEWDKVSIDDNLLDFKEEYIPPRYTLSYNGVPFAPLGGIHAITGQPGHGKTATFTMLMATFLNKEYYNFKYALSDVKKPKVLYIDTEMEKENTQLVAKRLYKILDWDDKDEQDQFFVLRLREELTATMRWRKTLKAIATLKPTVVFLDGMLDIVQDFNDNKECQELIYQCMATASHFGISLWCLLHQNPGSTKMVGHTGSFLERKATDVFMTKKEKDGSRATFTIKQIKARGRDIDDITFYIEDDENHFGIPKLNFISNVDMSIEKVEEYIRVLNENVETPVSNADLEKALEEHCGITNHGVRFEVLKKAKKRRFLILAFKEGKKEFYNINVEADPF